MSKGWETLTYEGDVFQCREHTRWSASETGHGAKPLTQECFRTGPCVPACHIMEAAKAASPLSAFIAKLFSYSDADLLAADAKKAAKHYGIRVEHARGYIELERQGRGLRT